jgi:hypothetical protein
MTAELPLQHRRHASVQHNEPSGQKEKDNIRLKWPITPNPTPYEIFCEPKSAPYSKLRYYELVKLYHPDRHHHTSHDDVPRLTKLERYRLVVAANDILSNPDRRRLYDIYGAGWGKDQDSRRDFRAAERAWRQKAGNASMNATWEDWERWYEQRDGKKQEPRFMSNLGFASLVAVFALLGSWGHITRAGIHSAELLDRREQHHISISKSMQVRQSQTAGLNREDRIKTFLRERDSWE